jgi:GNAT superfamily N-acetyltransferase
MRDARNRQLKRRLVEGGRSHGVLVYSNGEPVGWCQYGPKEELPRINLGATYRKFALRDDVESFWRITCFVVDREYRRRGVASVALKAALRAIKRKGGGVVEAYPIKRWGAYREYHGIVSMFQREGFQIVGPFGKSNVVMQRSV